jgi:hypothetical protein
LGVAPAYAPALLSRAFRFNIFIAEHPAKIEDYRGNKNDFRFNP